MKILQVITSLETGGAETLVCNIIHQLVLKRLDVDICLFNGVRTPLLDRVENCHNIHIYKFGESCYNFVYIFKLIRIMRGYDVVHTHNSSPQLFVAIANLLCGKKIVTTEHSTNNRKRSNKILSVIDKWMYSRYDRIICISQIAYNTLLSYLGNDEKYKNKMCVINNGIDVNTFFSARPILRSEIGSNSNRFIVVMVAGFREAKDQDTLIRAIAHLPKDVFELWLVGDGVRRKELQKCAAEENVLGNVKFLGVRMDVPSILKAANVVVMSSHWEGLSLSNIEGMSVGKPFIASNVDGLKQVTEGYGILFPHKDDGKLSEILIELKTNKDYYNQIANKCFERAKQFDISITVNNYIKVYETALSEC